MKTTNLISILLIQALTFVTSLHSDAQNSYNMHLLSNLNQHGTDYSIGCWGMEPRKMIVLK